MVVITRSHPDASPLSSDEVVHHAPGSNRLLPGSGASLLPARAVCLSCLPEGGQRREPPPYPVNGARMRKVDRVGGRLGSNGRGLSAVGRLLRSRVPGTALLMPQGGMSSQSVASATALNTSDAHPLCGGQPGPAVFRSILWSNGCC